MRTAKITAIILIMTTAFATGAAWYFHIPNVVLIHDIATGAATIYRMELSEGAVVVLTESDGKWLASALKSGNSTLWESTGIRYYPCTITANSQVTVKMAVEVAVLVPYIGFVYWTPRGESQSSWIKVDDTSPDVLQRFLEWGKAAKPGVWQN